MKLSPVLGAAFLLGLTAACGSVSADSTAGSTSSPPASPSASESATLTGSPSPEGDRPSIVGLVEHAPGCPNEPVGSPCRFSPVSGARVEVFARSASVASLTTGSDGRFELRVAPGTYRVTARSAAGGPNSTDTVSVSVVDRPVEVRLKLDSGIR